MALRTMGTSSTTALSALLYNQVNSPADVAALNALIKDDLNPLSKSPGTFLNGGLLMIPRRQLIPVFPGDFIAVDTQTGWPIVISAAAAAANPSWVHS